MAEAAAPAAAPAPAASLVLAVQRLLQDLRPDSVDEAAAIIAGTDLDVHQQADGLASEVGRWVLPRQMAAWRPANPCARATVAATRHMGAAHSAHILTISCLLSPQMYRAATSGPDKALAVAQLLGEVLALDPSGNGRQLRRLLLTRCEKAFDLSPPPGEARGPAGGCPRSSQAPGEPRPGPWQGAPGACAPASQICRLPAVPHPAAPALPGRPAQA